MPSVSQILDQRQARRDKHQRDLKPRLASGCAILLSLGIALLSLLLAAAYTLVSQDLPSIDYFPQNFEPPNGLLLQPTRFYDRNGEHVILVIQNPKLAPVPFETTKISQFRRNYLPVQPHEAKDIPESAGEYLPENIIKATLAISDPEFWRHPGFTLRGIINPDQKTLVQQLVASFLLLEEPPGLTKAIRERLLAAQITSRFGREKILEWYLNSADYGRFSFGLDEAARLYFDKPVSQLTLAEAALLAGVSQSPTLNPHDAPQAALARQKTVIQEMLRLRLISPDEGAQAATEKLVFSQSEQPGKSLLISDLQPNLAPAFINLAVAELDDILPRKRLERGGVVIQTTLDHQLQIEANCLLVTQLTRLGSSLAAIPASGCQAVEHLPALQLNEADSMPSALQAEAMLLNPQDGQILAFASHPAPQLQAGYLPTHPAGSLSTPFIYLTAFTRGMSPASLVWDTPYEADSPIQNFDNLYHGPLRLRVAMANDYLVAAQKTINQVGLQNVQRIASQFGLEPSQSGISTPITSANLLGNLDILQASRAMGIFANQGVLAGRENPSPSSFQTQGNSALSSVTILKISDLTGQLIHQANNPYTRPVISPQLAYLANHILQDEPARWASLGHPNSLETGYPLAAKLSRNLDGTSNWVFGYSPNRVIGFWLGSGAPAQNPSNQSSELLSSAAAGAWHALALYTMQFSPTVDDFQRPAGITTLEVCDPSGMLPDEDCPNTVNEIFLAGNEPLQTDSLFEEVAINRQNGLLATVFTPSELIENRVYMLVPEEEHIWVDQAGIPMPPQSYDTLPINPSASSEIQLLKPTMFSVVRGEVTIESTVLIDDLDFFRIQVGQGINPHAWFQVGEDISDINEEAFQVNWDTSDLEGVYTIQLLAVRQDQSIQHTAILVTVDNQAPEINIKQPYPGEILSIPMDKEFIFQADIQDNLGIQKVGFYLDGKGLAERFTSPFIATWKPVIGDHTLQIIAIDQAGNQTIVEIPFTIQ